MLPHFNEFCARYEQSNPLTNPNSTSLGPIAYTNHLQSFNDYDFVNSVAGLSTGSFSFQPPSSSLPSTYIENNNIASPRSFHQMAPFRPPNVIQAVNVTNENLENNTNNTKFFHWIININFNFYIIKINLDSNLISFYFY